MIRILTADEVNAITITVDGQLVDDSVDAVEKCSDEVMDRGKPVHLFLRDVSHIDEHGRSLLSRLAGKGRSFECLRSLQPLYCCGDQQGKTATFSDPQASNQLSLR